MLFCPTTAGDINSRRGESSVNYGRPDTQIDYVLAGLSPVHAPSGDSAARAGYSVIRQSRAWAQQSDGANTVFSFDSPGVDRVSGASVYNAHPPHVRRGSSAQVGINVIYTDGSGVWLPRTECQVVTAMTNTPQLIPPNARVARRTNYNPVTGATEMLIYRRGASVYEDMRTWGAVIRQVGSNP